MEDPVAAYAPPELQVTVGETAAIVPGWRWWFGASWRRYNAWIFLLGVIGYALQFKSNFHKEQTKGIAVVFEFVSWGVSSGFVFMFWVNCCYLLGPLLDLVVPRSRKAGYRLWAYRLGFGGSAIFMGFGILLICLEKMYPAFFQP